MEKIIEQARIPLLRSHDARKLLQMTEITDEYNRGCFISSHRNIVADAFALLSCPTPETGKSKFSPSRRFCNKKREMVVTK